MLLFCINVRQDSLYGVMKHMSKTTSEGIYNMGMQVSSSIQNLTNMVATGMITIILALGVAIQKVMVNVGDHDTGMNIHSYRKNHAEMRHPMHGAPIEFDIHVGAGVIDYCTITCVLYRRADGNLEGWMSCYKVAGHSKAEFEGDFEKVIGIISEKVLAWVQKAIQ